MTRSSEELLLSLYPNYPLEINWKEYKNSLRNIGGFNKKLRKPSRIPDVSRKYLKGDPTSLIDWKAYARTDQLIIREIQDEAAAHILIKVDASYTMFWPTKEILEDQQTHIKKIETALRIALHMAYIHVNLGDIVKVVLDDGDHDNIYIFSPISTNKILELYNYLLVNNFKKEIIFDDFIRSNLPRNNFDIIYQIGDGLSEINDFTSNGSRYIFLHVLSNLELDISWVKKDLSYFDTKNIHKEYKGDNLLYNNRYKKALNDWSHNVELKIQKNGGLYKLVTETTKTVDLHQDIITYASKRV